MESIARDPKKQRTQDGAVAAEAGGAPSDSKSTPSNRQTKPCTKFFSVSGCPYGDNCHFLHALPVTMQNTQGAFMGQLKRSTGDVGAAGGYKTRLCNKFSTSEGCKFGDKCHFAHGEHDLRAGNNKAGGGKQMEWVQRLEDKLVGAGYVSDYGVSNAAHVAINKYGGAPTGPAWGAPPGAGGKATLGSHNYKTKLCEKFKAGSCMFGEKCHFAHGQQELRRLGQTF